MNIDQAIPLTTTACLGLGALAKSWPRFPNAYIPTLVAIAGAIIVPSLSGWAALHVISGFIAGLGATGVHQQIRGVNDDIHRRRSGNTEILMKKDE